ncbi:hypothetical protein [uncultured Methanobrevibacter sp.]|uniref:hypothetical protein n=1 Tax=uncultured Methanobrevibacter sp. TaxID=253161 RepID=UPI00263114E5|nr:hypothetical protein [uncultured Methanobrevibacter sp.]
MVSEIKLAILVILSIVYLMALMYDRMNKHLSIYTVIWIVSFISIFIIVKFF